MRIVRRKDQILDAATEWLTDKSAPDYKPEDVTEAILLSHGLTLPVFACCICKGVPPALIQVVNDLLCRQCSHRIYQEIARV